MECIFATLLVFAFILILFWRIKSLDTGRITWADVRTIWKEEGWLGRLAVVAVYLLDKLLVRPSKWATFVTISLCSLGIPSSVCGLDVPAGVQIAEQVRLGFESFLDFLEDEHEQRHGERGPTNPARPGEESRGGSTR